jgi:hypothetical protein
VAFSALDAGLPIEVSGEHGIGKTAVLRHLSHHQRSMSFPDGCVYLEARHQPYADLLQLIFEAFFESAEICKPTDAEMRRGLHDKQALILLDDVDLASHELDQIIDVAPRSAFAVAAHERCLWGEVRSLALEGLPDEDAVSLLEREIERSLAAAEKTAAAALCTALEGHPLRIVQAASLIRDIGIPVDECARSLTPASLIAKLIASLDDKQRRALLALTALPGVPLQAQDIAGIAEVIDLEASLMLLVRRGLIVNSQSRHRLADGVGDQLRRTEDLKPWTNRAITYFTACAERNRRSPAILLEESEALLRAQQCAADARRWGEVIRLGRLIEGALVLAARWGAWAISVERCLVAAKATGDRSGEAWALHEMGTRDVCLGEPVTARTMLRQALTLRENLNDETAAAVTRRNLGFVLAPVSEDSHLPLAPRPGSVLDLDSLPLRDQTPPALRVASTKRVGVMLLAAVLVGVVGGMLARWASPEGLSFESWNAGSIGALLRGDFGGPAAAGATMARAPADGAAARDSQRADSATGSSGAETPGEDPAAPNALDSDKPLIRIFSQRPAQTAARGPTSLCYAVSGALRVRVEPDIGAVSPTSTLTCVRVAPSRTTTYEITAYGRDGDQVRQQLVVIVR